MSVGKVYFAWVAPGEAFDALTHAREDEDVFAVRISEEEGAFAVASVEIRNPRRGLLSPVNKQRAFISAEIDGQLTLLFSGRVVGIPASITGETIEIELIGRPDDHATVQTAFVQELQQSPRYHPALVAEADREDLTATLEGFAALPHWDRATGALTLAPIGNEGSQPVVDLVPLEDRFEVTFGSAPIDRVTVELDLAWEQTSPILSVPLEADPQGVAVGMLADMFGGNPRSFTADDFATRWPAPGDTLDGGWTVKSGYLEVADVEKVTLDVDVTVAAPRDPAYTEPTWSLDVFRTRFDGNLVLAAFYRQPRRERVRIEVQADLQPVVVFPEPELVALQVDGKDVAPDGLLQIQTTFRAPSTSTDGFATTTFFMSVDKPWLAKPSLASEVVFLPVLEAAVARAEARLRKSARCVTAFFQVPLGDAVQLSSASVVRIADDRIPGGAMTGKVVSLELVVSGNGQAYAEIEIGASVGRAESASGVPAFVPEYEAPAEPEVVTYCREVGVDNGQRAFRYARIRNDHVNQEALIRGLDLGAEMSKFAGFGYRWAQAVDDAAAKEVIERTLQENPTELDAELVNLEPVDETLVEVTAQPFGTVAIVSDINLEA